MTKWLLFCLLALTAYAPLGGCAQPARHVATAEPFAFKGTYDAPEVFEKRGVYYTRIGSRLRDGEEQTYTANAPHKMEGTFYIFERGKPGPYGGPGIEIGYSHGAFTAGRKNGQWVYVTFASPEATIREEYNRGKLLSRKPGAPYRSTP